MTPQNKIDALRNELNAVRSAAERDANAAASYRSYLITNYEGALNRQAEENAELRTEISMLNDDIADLEDDLADDLADDTPNSVTYVDVNVNVETTVQVTVEDSGPTIEHLRELLAESVDLLDQFQDFATEVVANNDALKLELECSNALLNHNQTRAEELKGELDHQTQRANFFGAYFDDMGRRADEAQAYAQKYLMPDAWGRNVWHAILDEALAIKGGVRP